MSISAHSVLSIQQFFTKNGHDPCAHPPYSHDFTLSTSFFVSLNVKGPKGEHAADVEEKRQKNGGSTRRNQIDEFEHCFQQWKKKHLNRCIASNGGYFEGD